MRDMYCFNARLASWLFIVSSLWLTTDALCLAAAPKEFRFTIKHFTVEGLSPLSQAFMDDYFKPLQNRIYSLKELQEVSKEFEKVIHEQGYIFYQVIVPQQTLAAGDVKLKVITFTLGEIDVTGNDYFSKDNIMASLPRLKKSASPNAVDLSEAIKVANKHPSKQVQVTFKPSKTPDEIDADIAVTNQRPYQASLIGNNYGTSTSGDYRLIAALQYSNLFGLDHIANASYSISPDHIDTVKQYGGSYSLPVYRTKGWLSAYYANSSVNIGTVATDITVTGSGEMYGLHYLQYLPKWGKYEHNLDIGIDTRYFVNSVLVNTLEVGSNVRSTPFSVLYKGEYPWLNSHTSYYLQWVANTAIGGQNSQSNYWNASTSVGSRFDAKQDWQLLRYGGNFLVNVKDWLVQTTLIGQQSPNPLIAGEQLGIGGSFDVRGYGQRETAADSAQIIKFEVTTPTWEKTSLFSFYDYGHGHQQSVTPGQVQDYGLSGTGIGTRFQWRDYFMGNVTYAHALDTAPDVGGTKAGQNRIYAMIVFKY